MAHLKRNEVMHSASGKIGDLIVFRQMNGKTVISRAPVKSGITSDSQQQVRDRFTQAVRYGKAALKNPELKQLYEARVLPGQTAFHVAFADFFKAPEIHSIDSSAYTGAAGNVIRMQVSDNILVKQVAVEITGADNKPLENGLAVMDEDGLNWSYIATQANPGVAGTKVTVSATDLPGNLTVSEKVLG